ncbi:MAG: fused MFS/spermidine synthase [Mycobacteriales bacterium]
MTSADERGTGRRRTRAGRPARTALPAGFAAFIVFVSAAAVLVLEILALRLIAPYVGVTLQTNTAVIGAALLAIALGAWTGGRVADRTDPGRLLGPLLLVAAALTLLTLPVVRFTGEATRGTDDASATLLLAMVAVVAPAALLSAVSPMVAKLQLHDLRQTGTVVGRLSGIGTLGAIVATFATGFVLVAAFPTSTILLGTGVVLAATGAAATWLRRRAGRERVPLPAAAVALLPVAALLVVLSPNPCQRETEYHCARVTADPQRRAGRTLYLDTLRHSYVDLADPTYLEFDYARAVAAVADAFRRPGESITALYVGGGGFTMPRYLAATRPGTRSTVLEIDRGVVALGRRRLGVDRIPDLTVRVGDARTGLAGQPPGRYDLVIGDAFGGIAVPWHLTTREVAEQVRDTLRPDGIYAVNVIDYQPDRFARAEIATLRAVFEHVAMIASAQTQAGQAGGNHILVAGRQPLPAAGISAGLARRGRWLLADEAATARFGGTARVLTDDRAPVDQLVTAYPS